MDKKRLPIHSPRLGLQPSVRKLSIITTFIFHYHLPILTTDHRPPTTDHRPPTTDHRPPTTDHRPPTTDHRPPTTDHRPPSTDHRSPSTEYRQIQFTSYLIPTPMDNTYKYNSCPFEVPGFGFDTWHLVICAMSEKWKCCIHIFGSRASGLGPRHSELKDLCNINEKSTCCTPGFKFRVSALETWWFVQQVKNGNVAYIFSGLGLRVSALGTRHLVICVI
jgi:hypothetical protein